LAVREEHRFEKGIDLCVAHERATPKVAARMGRSEIGDRVRAAERKRVAVVPVEGKAPARCVGSDVLSAELAVPKEALE
jgi:hypothetical protein